MRAIDYAGRTLGRSVVGSLAGGTKNKSLLWTVTCGCGASLVRSARDIGKAITRGGTLCCDECTSIAQRIAWRKARAKGFRSFPRRRAGAA